MKGKPCIGFTYDLHENLGIWKVSREKEMAFRIYPE